MMTPVKADEGVELSPMMADGWGVNEGARERVVGLCECVSYRPGRSGTGTGDGLVTGGQATSREATSRGGRPSPPRQKHSGGFNREGEKDGPEEARKTKRRGDRECVRLKRAVGKEG